MTHVAIIGCGVVGASIAYELSQISGLTVTVLDRQPPAQGSTGAALGVLMGVISQKTKGNAWKMRQTSIRRYETLIPELESKTGQVIPFNRQGILMLCFEEDLSRWRSLIEIRQTQGWRLEHWDLDELKQRCPQVVNAQVTAAIYSAQDRQVDPTALTLALVTAARQNGVIFEFDRSASGFEFSAIEHRCQQILTTRGALPVDWVVIAAGLGSADLTQMAQHSINIRPVLGQALRVRSPSPLGHPEFQPVITGDDIHLVPLANQEYWIGATVEFPPVDGGAMTANTDRLETVRQGAIALCPALATAEIIHTWSGLRPRPQDRPAPIIEPLAGCDNILLATGHYRNGVLLAPATAIAIRAAIESEVER
jgi:glycine/D-amino acid oxidase-like deaminating enzyme